MTKTRFSHMSYDELLHFAHVYRVDLGVSSPENRQELEDAVFEAYEDSVDDASQDDSFPMQYQRSRFGLATEAGSDARENPSEFDFPSRYNCTKLVAMLRDPAWLFAYWDISNQHQSRYTEQQTFQGFFLRLLEVPNHSKNEVYIMDIPVQNQDTSWYVYLPNRDTCYRLLLMANMGVQEEVLCSSTTVRVPSGGLSGELDILNCYEIDAIIALSGIAHLGVAEMPSIPQRILASERKVD